MNNMNLAFGRPHVLEKRQHVVVLQLQFLHFDPSVCFNGLQQGKNA
jgi:hypothetical protein